MIGIRTRDMSAQQHSADDDEMYHEKPPNDADDGDAAGAVFHESCITVMTFEERVEQVTLGLSTIEGGVTEVVGIFHSCRENRMV